jgi:uncharacterized membrane protein
MNVWRELTKRRELAERFVMVGLIIAIMGAGMWLWSVVGGGDDYTRREAMNTMVSGLLVAGVAMAVVAYRKRDRADN